MLVIGSLLSTKKGEVGGQESEVTQVQKVPTGEGAVRWDGFGEVARKALFYSDGALRPSQVDVVSCKL